MGSLKLHDLQAFCFRIFYYNSVKHEKILRITVIPGCIEGDPVLL